MRIKPYPAGMEIPGATVLDVKETAPLVELHTYRIKYDVCGHELVVKHKTIRNRIRLGKSHHYTGMCPSCSRTKEGRREAEEKNPPPKTVDDIFNFAMNLANRERHEKRRRKGL